MKGVEYLISNLPDDKLLAKRSIIIIEDIKTFRGFMYIYKCERTLARRIFLVWQIKNNLFGDLNIKLEFGSVIQDRNHDLQYLQFTFMRIVFVTQARLKMYLSNTNIMMIWLLLSFMVYISFWSFHTTFSATKPPPLLRSSKVSNSIALCAEPIHAYFPSVLPALESQISSW